MSANEIGLRFKIDYSRETMDLAKVLNADQAFLDKSGNRLEIKFRADEKSLEESLKKVQDAIGKNNMASMDISLNLDGEKEIKQIITRIDNIFGSGKISSELYKEEVTKAFKETFEKSTISLEEFARQSDLALNSVAQKVRANIANLKPLDFNTADLNEIVEYFKNIYQYQRLINESSSFKKKGTNELTSKSQELITNLDSLVSKSIFGDGSVPEKVFGEQILDIISHQYNNALRMIRNLNFDFSNSIKQGIEDGVDQANKENLKAEVEVETKGKDGSGSGTGNGSGGNGIGGAINNGQPIEVDFIPSQKSIQGFGDKVRAGVGIVDIDIIPQVKDVESAKQKIANDLGLVPVEIEPKVKKVESESTNELKTDVANNIEKAIDSGVEQATQKTHKTDIKVEVEKPENAETLKTEVTNAIDKVVDTGVEEANKKKRKVKVKPEVETKPDASGSGSGNGSGGFSGDQPIQVKFVPSQESASEFAGKASEMIGEVPVNISPSVKSAEDFAKDVSNAVGVVPINVKLNTANDNEKKSSVPVEVEPNIKDVSAFIKKISEKVGSVPLEIDPSIEDKTAFITKISNAVGAVPVEIDSSIKDQNALQSKISTGIGEVPITVSPSKESISGLINKITNGVGDVPITISPNENVVSDLKNKITNDIGEVPIEIKPQKFGDPSSVRSDISNDIGKVDIVISPAIKDVKSTRDEIVNDIGIVPISIEPSSESINNLKESIAAKISNVQIVIEPNEKNISSLIKVDKIKIDILPTVKSITELKKRLEEDVNKVKIDILPSIKSITELKKRIDADIDRVKIDILPNVKSITDLKDRIKSDVDKIPVTVVSNPNNIEGLKTSIINGLNNLPISITTKPESVLELKSKIVSDIDKIPVTIASDGTSIITLKNAIATGIANVPVGIKPNTTDITTLKYNISNNLKDIPVTAKVENITALKTSISAELKNIPVGLEINNDVLNALKSSVTNVLTNIPVTVDSNEENLNTLRSKVENKLTKLTATVNADSNSVTNLKNTIASGLKDVPVIVEPDEENISGIKSKVTSALDKLSITVEPNEENINSLRAGIEKKLNKVPVTVKANETSITELKDKLASKVNKVKVDILPNVKSIDELKKRIINDINKTKVDILPNVKSITDLKNNITTELGEVEVTLKPNEDSISSIKNKLLTEVGEIPVSISYDNNSITGLKKKIVSEICKIPVTADMQIKDVKNVRNELSTKIGIVPVYANLKLKNKADNRKQLSTDIGEVNVSIKTNEKSLNNIKADITNAIKESTGAIDVIIESSKSKINSALNETGKVIDSTVAKVQTALEKTPEKITELLQAAKEANTATGDEIKEFTNLSRQIGNIAKDMKSFASTAVSDKTITSVNNLALALERVAKVDLDKINNIKIPDMTNLASLVQINEVVKKYADVKSTIKETRKELEKQNEVDVDTAVRALSNANTKLLDSSKKSFGNGNYSVDLGLKRNVDEATKAVEELRQKSELTANQIRKLDDALNNSYNSSKKLDDLFDSSYAEKANKEIKKANDISINDAIRSLKEANKRYFDGTQRSFKNGDYSVDLDLKKKVDDATTAVKELKKNTDLTAEQIAKLDDALSNSLDTEIKLNQVFDDSQKSLLEKINKGFEGNKYAKEIDKIEKSISDFSGYADEAKQNVEELNKALLIMSDSGASDIEKINAFMSFKSNKDSANSIISNLNTRMNTDASFKDRIDSMKEYDSAIKNVEKSLKRWKDRGITNVNTEQFTRFGNAFEDIKKSVDGSTESYKKQSDALDKLNDEMSRFEKYHAGQNIIGNVVGRDNESQALDTIRNTLTKHGAVITGELTSSDISSANGIKMWTTQVREFNGTVKDVTVTWNTLDGIISTSTKNISKELTGLPGVMETFKKKVKDVATYWAAQAFNPMRMISAVRQGIGIIQQYDDALVELRKVSDDSEESLQEFAKTSFDLSNTIGSTGLQLQQSAADFLRLGESINEATKHAKEANILFNVSEFTNISDATESFISMIQAFKDVDSLDVINKLNVVGNNFAISTSGLAEALRDSASALSVAGNDIDKSIALITGANRVVQSASEVGKGLRTIALRLTGTKVAVQELQD